ncbi:hypothetical protein ACFLXN_01050 [Chloroflexota bacterium]
MNTKKKLCKANRADGRPCQARAIKKGFCFAHSPELADKAREARILGGKNKAKSKRLEKMMPTRLSPILETLEDTMTEVRGGRLAPKTATAMATLANAIVRVLTAGELEQRVRDLERQYKLRGSDGS